MLSKESAQLLIQLIAQHVRVTPDGGERATELFEQFQQAVRELNAVLQSVDTSN